MESFYTIGNSQPKGTDPKPSLTTCYEGHAGEIARIWSWFPWEIRDFIPKTILKLMDTQKKAPEKYASLQDYTS